MRASIKRGDFLSDEVVEVRFSAKDFADGRLAPKLVNSHEFELNGLMYDVVSARVEKDHLVIRCIPDKRENQLATWFIKFNKDKNDHSKKFNSNSAFSFGHFGVTGPVHVPPIATAANPAPHIHPEYLLPTGHFSVPAPPPWFIA